MCESKNKERKDNRKTLLPRKDKLNKELLDTVKQIKQSSNQTKTP